jgi:hypothetical protein
MIWISLIPGSYSADKYRVLSETQAIKADHSQSSCLIIACSHEFVVRGCSMIELRLAFGRRVRARMDSGAYLALDLDLRNTIRHRG